MQRLKVVLNFRNDFVVVNHTATHLPPLSGAGTKPLKQSGHGMSVSVGGIQSDGQNVKNDINPRLSREVNNPCRAHIASELLKYLEYSRQASCRCKVWWVYTDRPQLARYPCQKQ